MRKLTYRQLENVAMSRDKQIDELRGQLLQASNRAENLQAAVNNVTGDRDRLRKQIDDLASFNRALVQQLPPQDKLKQEISRLRGYIERVHDLDNMRHPDTAARLPHRIQIMPEGDAVEHLGGPMAATNGCENRRRS